MLNWTGCWLFISVTVRMDIIELGTRYSTLSIYYREKCNGDIEDVLSQLEDNLNDFKKCCFGKLYKFPENSIRNNEVYYCQNEQRHLLVYSTNWMRCHAVKFELILISNLYNHFSSNGLHDWLQYTRSSTKMKNKRITRYYIISCIKLR